MFAVIIQARMGSSRLPGKVMKKILGKPVIYYLIQRLKCIKEIDKIIIATSNKTKDSEIVKYCVKNNINYFTGSESNVLKRIYDTAKFYDVEDIVRITADCPLIDSEIISKQIINYKEKKLDYSFLGLTFAEGICADIFSFKTLENIYINANEEDDKEHITPYLHKRKNKFKVEAYENKTDDSKYRIVLDCEEDFKLIETLINNLYKKDNYFTTIDIKEFLFNNPEVFKLNSGIIRNESYDVFSIKEKK